MGIEQVLEGGLFLDDLEYLLKGHIKKGYRVRQITILKVFPHLTSLQIILPL
jgi:hypothetical protein